MDGSFEDKLNKVLLETESFFDFEVEPQPRRSSGGDQFAIYYDGKLLGTIMNPDAYPGGVMDLCQRLSPDEGLCHAVKVGPGGPAPTLTRGEDGDWA